MQTILINIHNFGRFVMCNELKISLRCDWLIPKNELLVILHLFVIIHRNKKDGAGHKIDKICILFCDDHFH